jgi:DNA-binding LacI/PurR family transcriptional regulator/predicted NBD/HSP70 family sugar kinase
VLAIDIQVDTIGLAFVGIGGIIPRQIRLDRPKSRLSPEQTLLDIEGALWALGDRQVAPRKPVAVGIAVAGIVAGESGIVVTAPNLGWHDVNLRHLVQPLVGPDCEIYVANDGPLGCLGENVRGTAVGIEDLLYVSGEVGVGWGAIVGGRPLVGANGHGGGWSHMMVNPSGSRCRCGEIGCWETEIGEQALLHRAGKAASDGGRVAVDELLRASAAGDPTAVEAIEGTGSWLAAGLSNLALVLNPRVVVLGGTLEKLFTLIEPMLQTEVRRRLSYGGGEHPEIRPSRLGGDAPLIGAAELAMRRQIVRLVDDVQRGGPDTRISPSIDGSDGRESPGRSPEALSDPDQYLDAESEPRASAVLTASRPGPAGHSDERDGRSATSRHTPTPTRLQDRKRKRVIGLLVADPSSPFVREVVRGVEGEAAVLGYGVSVIRTDATSESEARRHARAVDRRMDGLILVLAIEVDPYAQPVRGRKMPLVLLDHDRDAPGTTFVTSANRRGAILATDHLIGLGHERVGMITGTPGTGPARERLAGYRDSLVQAGIPYDSRLVVEGNFMEARGRTAASELLALDLPPTAMLTSSDSAAFGALAAISDAGLSVPKDISVVGFDDIPEAAIATPPLTTVRQPLSEMGGLALRLLDQMIYDPTETELRLEVATELVVRGSTGPVRVPMADRR